MIIKVFVLIEFFYYSKLQNLFMPNLPLVNLIFLIYLFNIILHIIISYNCQGYALFVHKYMYCTSVQLCTWYVLSSTFIYVYEPLKLQGEYWQVFDKVYLCESTKNHPMKFNLYFSKKTLSITEMKGNVTTFIPFDDTRFFNPDKINNVYIIMLKMFPSH